MILPRFSRASCALLFSLLLTTAHGQTIWYVDDDAQGANTGANWTDAYSDLHSALTAAQSGDQVWVAAGRYVGNFTLKLEVGLYGGFAGAETKLTQRDWTANPTILDGNYLGSVVTAPAGATATTRIDGFTITKGSGTSSPSGKYRFGGGLYLTSSSPTIANNTIRGNSTNYGGGLYTSYSSPTITNNTITINSANIGGGLYLDYSAASTIANNTIVGNAAFWGGGLYLEFKSISTIANNTIAGNSAIHGGGLYLDYISISTIANNSITNNSAESGGGLHLIESSLTMVNNTITGNSASSGRGGGLYLYDSSPTIVNTIVAFNSSGLYQTFGSTSTPELRVNCVYGNGAYDYSGIADPTGTNGNISAEPLLVRNPSDGGDGWGDDPATPDVDEGANDDFGDPRLLSNSPCIDAGENASVPADAPDLDGDGNTTEPLPYDLAGRSRFVDDPLTADTGSGTPPIVDMGAREFWTPVDFDDDGSVDLPDCTIFEACMVGPGGGVTAACRMTDLNHDGAVDIRDWSMFQQLFRGGP